MPKFYPREDVEAAAVRYGSRLVPGIASDWFKRQALKWLWKNDSCATPLHVAPDDAPEWVTADLRAGRAVHRFDLSVTAADALVQVLDWLRDIESVAVAGHPEPLARKARKWLGGLTSTNFDQALEQAEGWREMREATDNYDERHTDLYEETEIPTQAGHKWTIAVSCQELGDIGDILGMCFGWKTPVPDMRDIHHADLRSQKAEFWILKDGDGSPLAAVKVRRSPHYVDEAKASGNDLIKEYRREVRDLLQATGAAADPYDFKRGLDEDCKDDLAAIGMLEPAASAIDQPDDILDDGTRDHGTQLWTGNYVAVIKSPSGIWWRLRWTQFDRCLESCLTRFPYRDARLDVDRVGKIMAKFLAKNANAFWLEGHKVHLADSLAEFVDGEHWRSAVESTKTVANQIFHKLPRGWFIEQDNSPTAVVEYRNTDRRRKEVLDKTQYFDCAVDFVNENAQLTFWKWVNPEATSVHGFADIKRHDETQEPRFGIVPTPGGWKSASKGWDAFCEEDSISYVMRWVLDVTPKYIGFVRTVNGGATRTYALQIGAFKDETPLAAGTLRWRSAKIMEFDFTSPGRTPSAAAKLLNIATDRARKHPKKIKLRVSYSPPFVHRGKDGVYVGAKPPKGGPTSRLPNFPRTAFEFDNEGRVLWTAPVVGVTEMLGSPSGFSEGWERAAINTVISEKRTVDEDWTDVLSLSKLPFVRNSNGGIGPLLMPELYKIQFGRISARRDPVTDQIAWTIRDQEDFAECRLEVFEFGLAELSFSDDSWHIERTDDLRTIVSAILDVGGFRVDPVTLAWLGLRRIAERHVEIGETENALCGDSFDITLGISWVRQGRNWVLVERDNRQIAKASPSGFEITLLLDEDISVIAEAQHIFRTLCQEIAVQGPRTRCPKETYPNVQFFSFDDAKDDPDDDFDLLD